jgi:GT2 family glycosyltransferase
MLGRCIAAILAQTDRDFEVVVVDNGSTDGAPDRLPADPRLRIRPMGENLGFAAANNRAILDCAAPFIALVNQDAFLDPDWLAAMKPAATAQPAAVMLASLLLKADDPIVLDGAGDALFFAGVGWRGGIGRPAPADLAGGEPFGVCAAAALYRTDALKAAGGFAESFGSYIEDVDLSFRLRLAGGAAAFVPEARALHVGSASGGRDPDRRTALELRNQVWTFVRCMPWPLFWLALPAMAAFNAAVAVRLAFRGRWSVARIAYGGALRALPRVWRERRAIQRARTASASSIARHLTFDPRKLLHRAIVLKR